MHTGLQLKRKEIDRDYDIKMYVKQCDVVCVDSINLADAKH